MKPFTDALYRLLEDVEGMRVRIGSDGDGVSSDPAASST